MAVSSASARTGSTASTPARRPAWPRRSSSATWASRHGLWSSVPTGPSTPRRTRSTRSTRAPARPRASVTAVTPTARAASRASTGDLAFVGGALYLSTPGPASDLDTGFVHEDLVRVDAGTGEATLVGHLGTRDINTGDVTGFLTVWGLATPNNVDLYGVLGRQVIAIDPQTAAGTLLVADYGVPGFEFLGGANGAAIATESAPEPLASALLVGALAALAGLRSRRRGGARSRTLNVPA